MKERASTLERLLRLAYQRHLLDEHRFVGSNVALRIGQVCLSLDRPSAALFLCGVLARATAIAVTFSRR